MSKKQSRIFNIKFAFLLVLGYIAVLRLVSCVNRARIIATATSQIEALNGAIGDSVHPYFGLDEIYFAVEGLRPLVTDARLCELAPLLAIMRVRYIGLTNTKVTDLGVSALIEATCDTIRVIELSGTDISVVILEELSHCPELRQISIPSELLTRSGIAHIEACKSLKKVVVFGAESDDANIQLLQQLIGNRVHVQANPKSHFHARSG